MWKIAQFGLLGLLISVLAACGSKGGTKPKDETPTDQPAPIIEEHGSTQGLDPTLDAEGTAMDTAVGGDMPEQRIIYFDYDRSDVRLEAQTILDEHAKYLAANPGAKIRLEGHADERGSREYNLALGEMRALAVRRYLNILGVPMTQISVHSYGEELPVDPTHSETSWQMNRRVEIVYEGGM